MSIVIRDCTDADMARITEIYGRSVREETASFEFEPPERPGDGAPPLRPV